MAVCWRSVLHCSPFHERRGVHFVSLTMENNIAFFENIYIFLISFAYFSTRMKTITIVYAI